MSVADEKRHSRRRVLPTGSPQMPQNGIITAAHGPRSLAEAPDRPSRRRPGPRDRHLTHENVPLADVLAGYPAISHRDAAPPPPRTAAR